METGASLGGIFIVAADTGDCRARVDGVNHLAQGDALLAGEVLRELIVLGGAVSAKKADSERAAILHRTGMGADDRFGATGQNLAVAIHDPVITDVLPVQRCGHVPAADLGDFLSQRPPGHPVRPRRGAVHDDLVDRIVRIALIDHGAGGGPERRYRGRWCDGRQRGPATGGQPAFGRLAGAVAIEAVDRARRVAKRVQAGLDRPDRFAGHVHAPCKKPRTMAGLGTKLSERASLRERQVE